MQNRKFQIFVSSTFIDLQDERRAVIEAILDLGHIPIGMEAFQASNEEQWSYIKKRIDETDYYVVIVAERYGSETKEGISYTEAEYDYAREKGVPVAAFLLHEDARKVWRAEKAEFIDSPKKVDALRQKCQGLMVRYWKNKDELAGACVKSLSQMFVAAPRDGWVPAKDAVGPDVANELARLIKENKDLKATISEIKEANVNTYSRIKEKLEIKFIDVIEIFAYDYAEKCNVKYNIQNIPIKISYFDIFYQVNKSISMGIDEVEMDNFCSEALKSRREFLSTFLKESTEINTLYVSVRSYDDFFKYLFFLGLLNFSSDQWHYTEKGREFGFYLLETQL